MDHDEMSPKEYGNPEDAVLNDSDQEPITPEERRRLVRKIDMVLMPLMMMTYALNYIDKAVYSIAALFGMVVYVPSHDLWRNHCADDPAPHAETSPLKLDTGNMIFYVGLLVGSPLFAYIGQRYNIARTIGVTPCFLVFTSMWYTKSEQALRVGIWYSGTGWGVLIGSPLAYGILKIKTHIALWRVLYLFWGSITIVFGIALFVFLPSSPVNTRYLSKRERYIAVERLREDQSSIENKTFKREQAFEALTDPKVILLSVLSFLLLVANGAVSTFTPLVIQTVLKSTNFQTLLLIMPGGVLASTMQILGGYVASRTTGMRSYIALMSISVTLICAALLWQLPLTNKKGLLASIYLMATFSASIIMIYSLTSSNVAGHTKKVTAASMVSVMTGLGNIAGPLFFQADDAPRYAKGFMGTVRRDAMGAEGQVDHAFQDLTDGQNMAFRYAY
ncbi:hypothetical protein RQP46_008355 [Phenoliferia psychrophenolica]